MAERLRKEGSAPIAAAMSEKLFSATTRRERPALVDAWRRRMAEEPPEALARNVAAMRDRPDRRHVLAAIRVPALVIVGGDDVVTTPAENEAIAKAVPGARLRSIPGCGHVPNAESPDAFNQALIEFLDTNSL
jgi:pimeloyl-ACP methyl ester carboxylesterase